MPDAVDVAMWGVVWGALLTWWCTVVAIDKMFKAYEERGKYLRLLYIMTMEGVLQSCTDPDLKPGDKLGFTNLEAYQVNEGYHLVDKKPSALKKGEMCIVDPEEDPPVEEPV